MLSPGELSELWKRHSAALLLMARGHCGMIAHGVAEDCVQEAFIRLATHDPPPRDSTAWLFTSVRNAAIDAVRSQQRRVRREQAVADLHPGWLEPVDAASIDHPTATELQEALGRLDDTTRDIVVAHLWNELTFRQIAAAFELSTATAHRKYEAGIAALRSLMQAPASVEQQALP